MKLKLVGHEYKYAVEQIMLALFPNERPCYTSDHLTGSGELYAESRLSIGSSFAQATTIMRCGDKVSRGIARVRADKLSEKLIADRLLQRTIKQAFYRAAEVFIDSPPVWGSLTGIRPAKIAAAAIQSCTGFKAAADMLVRKYYVSRERASMCLEAAKASIALQRTISPGDIALYIGVPFCPTRCAYCSFVSNSVEKSHSLIGPFVETLLYEISVLADMVNDLKQHIISVYIGGGTPTALPEESLDKVMLALKTSFDLSHVKEYTVEAGRPDTITPGSVDIIQRLGAGRICVNPQSMSDSVLANIGRRHTRQDAIAAVKLIRSAAPDMSLNMDVIAGLPGDTPEGFRQTLDAVLGLGPENVTIHTLSLKKGSRIMLEGTDIPCASDVALMLGYASNRLMEHGYAPYYLYRQKFISGGFENTGWSLPGHEGVYNICMMEELCTVIALGGGGVTKLVSSNGRLERIFNAKYPREYILKAGEITGKAEKIRRFIVHKQEEQDAVPILYRYH